MKQIYFSFLSLFILTIFVVSGAYAQVSNPTPHNLSAGDYSLNQWDSAAPAMTYPSNMIFHMTVNPTFNSYDPAAEGTHDWICPYNLTSRSRILGKGTAGIGFAATSTAQGVDCNSASSDSTRHVGAVVLSLNTLNRNNITVTWTGGTVIAGDGTPDPRIFTIRLQYRIGESGAFTDVPGPVEYLAQSSGHSQTVGPATLPSSAENQPVVQLRWVYYQVSAGNGGTRPQMRLDDITVTSNPTGIIKNNLVNEINYNYSPSDLTLELFVKSTNSEKAEIAITDILGIVKEKRTVELIGNKTQKIKIDVATYKEGIYMIAVNGKSINGFRKFYLTK